MTLDFKPISLDDQTDYLQLLGNCPQVASDYSFLNLWAWAEEYGLHWAWQENLVWIKQMRPDELFWAPVGDWNFVDWRRVFDGQADRRLEFIRVPQKLAESWTAAVEFPKRECVIARTSKRSESPGSFAKASSISASAARESSMRP